MGGSQLFIPGDDLEEKTFFFEFSQGGKILGTPTLLALE